jgi:hypothetical protein
MRWIVFAVFALASFSVTAGSLDVNLSNDTIEAKYDSPVGAADWTFGGMYNRDDKNYTLDIGLLASGDGSAGGSAARSTPFTSRVRTWRRWRSAGSCAGFRATEISHSGATPFTRPRS